MKSEFTKRPIVRHRSETKPLECPFGQTERVVTGGQGGIANVHVVTVEKGLPHVHKAYDEVYYFLSGKGTITLDGDTNRVAQGSVAVIPAGVPHSLAADEGTTLEFIIFGTPPLRFDDERARPTSVS